MFIILAYDINTARVSKIMRICKKYLRPVQKSVFEGRISGKKLELLKNELGQIIHPEEDAICIYTLSGTIYAIKEEIGRSVKCSTTI